jgi:hypothetical protein
MDSESVALASTAAATVVTLLTTDAWAKAKQEITGLWRRYRPEHADIVEAELAEAHNEAVAGDEAVARALAAEWESRLRQLMAADATAANELSRVVSTLTRALAEQDKKVTINQQVTASGHAAVIQVAGDARIGAALVERGSSVRIEPDGHLS